MSNLSINDFIATIFILNVDFFILIYLCFDILKDRQCSKNPCLGIRQQLDASPRLSSAETRQDGWDFPQHFILETNLVYEP